MDKITWTTNLAASRRDLVMRCLIRFWKEPQITGFWEKVNTAGSQSSIYVVSSQLEEGFSCNDITGIISGKPYRPELIRGKRKQNTFALTIIYQPRECPGYLRVELLTFGRQFEDPFILNIQWYSIILLVNRMHVKTEMVLILLCQTICWQFETTTKDSFESISHFLHQVCQSYHNCQWQCICIAENKTVEKC